MFCTFAHRIIKPLNVHTDMFRHILYYVTSVFLLLHPYVCYSTDYKPDKETEKRIEALLGKMTLEEKIGQMNQLHCENFPYLKTETRKGRVGSVMSIIDPNILMKYNVCCRRLPPRYSAYQRQRRDTRIQNHLPYTFGATPVSIRRLRKPVPGLPRPKLPPQE